MTDSAFSRPVLAFRLSNSLSTDGMSFVDKNVRPDVAVAVRKRMRDAAFGGARVPKAHFRGEAGGSSFEFGCLGTK